MFPSAWRLKTFPISSSMQRLLLFVYDWPERKLSKSIEQRKQHNATFLSESIVRTANNTLQNSFKSTERKFFLWDFF